MKLWSKWLIGAGTVAALGGTTIGGIYAFAKDPDNRGYQHNSKYSLRNDMEALKDVNKYVMTMRDPVVNSHVIARVTMASDGAKINGVKAKKWVNDYIARTHKTPPLFIQAGPLKFTNFYTDGIYPEEFIGFVQWFTKNVPWTPGVSSISSYTIKKGVEKQGRGVILGSYHAEVGESNIIKFLPDSFYGLTKASDLLGNLTNKPVTLEKAKQIIDSINTLNEKNITDKQKAKGELVSVYSLEKQASGKYHIKYAVGGMKTYKALHTMYDEEKPVGDVDVVTDASGHTTLVNRPSKKVKSNKQVPYLSFVKGMMAKHWKGVTSNFLKYVTAHEYGHMQTLATMKDAAEGAVQVGPSGNAMANAANPSGLVNIDNLNLYLSARAPQIKAILVKPNLVEGSTHGKFDTFAEYEKDHKKWVDDGSTGLEPAEESYMNIAFKYSATPLTATSWKTEQLSNIFAGVIDSHGTGSPYTMTGQTAIDQVKDAIAHPGTKKQFRFLMRDVKDLRAFAAFLKIPVEAVMLMNSFDNLVQTVSPQAVHGVNEVPEGKVLQDGKWVAADVAAMNLKNKNGDKYFDTKSTYKQEQTTAKAEFEKFHAIETDVNARTQYKSNNPNVTDAQLNERILQAKVNFFSYVIIESEGKVYKLNKKLLADNLGVTENHLSNSEVISFIIWFQKNILFKGNMYLTGPNPGIYTRNGASFKRKIPLKGLFGSKESLVTTEKTTVMTALKAINNFAQKTGVTSTSGAKTVRVSTITNLLSLITEVTNSKTTTFYGDSTIVDVINGHRYVGSKGGFNGAQTGKKWSQSLLHSLYTSDLTSMFNIVGGETPLLMFDNAGVSTASIFSTTDTPTILEQRFNSLKTKYPSSNTKKPTIATGATETEKIKQWQTQIEFINIENTTQFSLNNKVNQGSYTKYINAVSDGKLKKFGIHELISLFAPNVKTSNLFNNKDVNVNGNTFSSEHWVQPIDLDKYFQNGASTEEKQATFMYVYKRLTSGLEDFEITDAMDFKNIINKLKNTATNTHWATNSSFVTTLFTKMGSIIGMKDSELIEYYNKRLSSGISGLGITGFRPKTLAALSRFNTFANFTKAVPTAADLISYNAGNTEKETDLYKWLEKPDALLMSEMQSIFSDYTFQLPEVLTRDWVQMTYAPAGRTTTGSVFNYGSRFGKMDEKTSGIELYLNPKFIYDKNPSEYTAIENAFDYFSVVNIVFNALKQFYNPNDDSVINNLNYFATKIDAFDAVAIKVKSSSNGMYKDRWLRDMTSPDAKTGRKPSWVIYDDNGDPVIDPNIRITGFDGTTAITDRAQAYWTYLMKSYGVGDRSVAAMWRVPGKDALTMWGFVKKDVGEKIKYIKATSADGTVKYIEVQTKVDNLFYLTHQGSTDPKDKHTISDDGYMSWSLKSFLTAGTWTDSILSDGSWKLEFVDKDHKGVLDTLGPNAGKNAFTMGKRKMITEAGKPVAFAPIHLEKNNKDETVIVVTSQFA